MTIKLTEVIAAEFTPHTFFRQPWGANGGKLVTAPAVSCSRLKRLHRGLVYQNQERFCRQIQSLGLEISWCDSIQQWVVHNPA